MFDCLFAPGYPDSVCLDNYALTNSNTSLMYANAILNTKCAPTFCILFFGVFSTSSPKHLAYINFLYGSLYFIY